MIQIPVIDIFAGPGGLGEGFSRYLAGKPDIHPFEVCLSVEKDIWAWRTLRLRAMFRSAQAVSSSDLKPLAAYWRYVNNAMIKRPYGGRLPKNFHASNLQLKILEQCFKENSPNEFSPITVDDEVGRQPMDITLPVTKRFINQNLRKIRKKSDHWILVGGPPCQAYSLVGRSRQSRVNTSKFLSDKRHTLYKQYVGIIRDHKPSIFVMENVKGILSSSDPDKINTSVFDQIRSALCNGKNGKQEYELFSMNTGTIVNDPRDFIIRGEEYGIPQTRHRVIILGIRCDLSSNLQIKPLLEKSAKPQPTTYDAICDLPKLRSSVSCRKPKDDDELDPKEFESLAWDEAIHRAIELLKARDSRVPSSLLHKAANRLNSQLPVDSSKFSEHSKLSEWSTSVPADWFHVSGGELLLNHQGRQHMASDLVRYLFVSDFAIRKGFSPKLKKLIDSGLGPLHLSAAERDGKIHADRFKTHLMNHPAKTITSHSGKDGHANIHFDPTQCRSLTVREAARIQTFPDDYFFEGSMKDQYQQVGNAVPPLLALKIADVVFKVLTHP